MEKTVTTVTLDLGDWYILAIVYPLELHECYEQDWEKNDKSIIIKDCDLIREFGKEFVKKLVDFYTSQKTGDLIFYLVAKDTNGDRLEVTKTVAAVKEIVHGKPPLVKIRFIDVDEWLRSRNDP